MRKKNKRRKSGRNEGNKCGIRVATEGRTDEKKGNGEESRK